MAGSVCEISEELDLLSKYIKELEDSLDKNINKNTKELIQSVKKQTELVKRNIQTKKEIGIKIRKRIKSLNYAFISVIQERQNIGETMKQFLEETFACLQEENVSFLKKYKKLFFFFFSLLISYGCLLLTRIGRIPS